MARENPAFLGKRLKECYLARDGAAVREMLMPVAPQFDRADPFRPSMLSSLNVESLISTRKPPTL